MERDARRAAGLPGVEPGAGDEDDDSDSEEILDLVPEVLLLSLAILNQGPLSRAYCRNCTTGAGLVKISLGQIDSIAARAAGSRPSPAHLRLPWLWRPWSIRLLAACLQVAHWGRCLRCKVISLARLLAFPNDGFAAEEQEATSLLPSHAYGLRVPMQHRQCQRI